MSKNKVTVSITVDKDIWEIAKYKLPCNRSRYLESCLIKAVYSDNEIDVLEKEIVNEEKELLAKKEKLNKLKEFREANSSNKDKIDKAMNIVYSIVNKHKCISEAQIIHISNSNFLNTEVLTDIIKNKGIKITKFTAEEKEINIKKSKSIF